MENVSKSNMQSVRLLPFDPIVLVQDVLKRWLVVVLAALAVTVAQPLMPWLLGFAAGAMLLVTVRELIPEACGGAERAGTLSVLAGFLLMMILDVALG